MKRSLLLLLVAGCGDLRNGESLGDPIWVMHADLEGVALGDPEGEYRALFGWLTFGEGDFFDCYEQMPWWQCGDRVSYLAQLNHGPSEIVPVLDGVDVPVFRFPEEEELLSRDGAVLALGGLGIYDDRNGNGELDEVTFETPTDRLVAESITPPDYRSLAVFREGPLHPVWDLYRDLFGCPDPPQGYSVARVWLDGLSIKECKVERDTHLLVSASSDDETTKVRCMLGTSGFPIDVRAKSHQPVELPANARVVSCTATPEGGSEVTFYLDNGNVCDQFDTNFYTLQPNQVPPPGWPCS